MNSELERAAYHERKLMEKEGDVFTPEEIQEAEDLLAEIERLVARADALNRTIVQRLKKEAAGDPEKAVHLKRFQEEKGLTVKLAAF